MPMVKLWVGPPPDAWPRQSWHVHTTGCTSHRTQPHELMGLTCKVCHKLHGAEHAVRLPTYLPGTPRACASQSIMPNTVVFNTVCWPPLLLMLLQIEVFIPQPVRDMRDAYCIRALPAAAVSKILAGPPKPGFGKPGLPGPGQKPARLGPGLPGPAGLLG